MRVVNASDYQRFMTSRIDCGEASCLEIIDGGGCDYLLTGDFRALGEKRKTDWCCGGSLTDHS